MLPLIQLKFDRAFASSQVLVILSIIGPFFWSPSSLSVLPGLLVLLAAQTRHQHRLRVLVQVRLVVRCHPSSLRRYLLLVGFFEEA